MTVQPGPSLAGPDGAIKAVARAANGDLVAAGTFETAGSVLAHNVARWNGTAWSALGSGMDADVREIMARPNGDLIFVGGFATAGGQSVGGLAIWNGSSWQAFGGGTDGQVYAIIEAANGDLIISGYFNTVGGQAATNVARWNGSSWSAVGLGVGVNGLDGPVSSLVEFPNGDVLAGGSFFMPNGQAATLARWNGAVWTAYAGWVQGQRVPVQMLAMPNGDIAMAGTFQLPSGNASVVSFNGTTLQDLAPTIAGQKHIALDANGMLLAAGYSFTPQDKVQRYNGTSWASIADGTPLVVADLYADATSIVVSGHQPAGAGEMIEFGGQSWQALGAVDVPVINTMLRMPGGDLVFGGDFDQYAGVPASNIMRWDGNAFSAIGGGVGVSGRVLATAVAPNGNLIVGGTFYSAGGSPAQFIAQWDGNWWSTFGSGLPGYAHHVAVAGSGEVFAVVGFDVWRFNGMTWVIEQTGASMATRKIVRRSDGSLVFFGFHQVPGSQAQYAGPVVYDGTGYSLLDPSTPIGTTHGVVMPNDDLVVSGTLNNISGIYRWNGTTWSLLSTESNTPLAVTAEGDLFAVFQGNQVSRWNGSTWDVVAIGSVNGAISNLEFTASRDLLIAGSFTTAGGQVSNDSAFATPNCPATTVSYGVGCVGAGGTMSLSASGGAWLDSTVTSTASGFTAMSLGLHLVGVNAAVSTLPLGAPGCSVLVSPILFDALVPVSGVATATIAVPNATVLIGNTLRSQVVGIELTAQSAIVQTTATNGLAMTVGSM